MNKKKLNQDQENKKFPFVKALYFIASSLIIAFVLTIMAGYGSTFARTIELTALEKRMIVHETRYDIIIDKLDKIEQLLEPSIKRSSWHKKQPR